MNQLLPAPKSIEKLGDEFVPKEWDLVYFPQQIINSVQEILQIIEEKWSFGLNEQNIEQQDIVEGYVFLVGEKEQTIHFKTLLDQGKPNLNGKTDAYLLNIQKEGIFAWSKTLTGLYYALQTLRQILKGQELYELLIVDWPDLLYRGVHLDAKGERPGFEKLKRTFKEWSHYKVNTVLFEYEDTFPYSSQPDIPGSNAYSRQEIEELQKYARDHFITIVPLVQSIGHVEYILKNSRFAPLREDGEITQFCSSRDEVFDLMADLIFEIAEAHPESPWIHIGGDEAWYLGHCPDCADQAASHGLGRLYIDHMNRVIQLVKRTGKRPIIWDDVLRKLASPEEIERLDRACIIHYWDYQTCGNPLDSDWIRLLQSLDFQVMGASAMRGASGMDSFAPDFVERFRNSKDWGFTADRFSLQGVISTSWGRYGTLKPLVEPFDLGWYGALASAEHFWNTRGMDNKEYDQRFAQAFLHVHSGGILKGLKKYKKGLPYKAGWLEGRKPLGDEPSGWFLSLMEAIWKWRTKEEFVSRKVEILEARLYRAQEEAFPDWERWRISDRVHQLQQQLIDASEELRSSLGEIIENQWVNEYSKAFTYKYVFRLENVLKAFTPPTPRPLETFVNIGTDYG